LSITKTTIGRFPKIGWWLDKKIVTFYHGTHKSNLPYIEKTGILAPREGPTAGLVSIALEPNTSHGYAAMSGAGGESAFRAAGASVKNVPHADRITFILAIPQSYFFPRMAPQRGNVSSEKDKLTNKNRYDKEIKNGKSDVEYYALTEIRLPNSIPLQYIKSYTYLRPA
jgi:hypothetical protein